MKNSDSENTNSIWVRYKPGRRFYVFVISLILASGFWLLNALNKTYSEAVTISLKYINLPENRAFSPIPNNNIKIDLTGDGYSLIQIQQIAEEDTVVIDLNTIDFVSIREKKRAQLPTSQIISELKSELNNNVNISRVNVDTIEIVTEIGVNKELLVKPNYSISLTKGMVLKRPVYTVPATIETIGPVSVLENMDELQTEHIVLDEVSEYVEIELKLAYNTRFLKPEFKTVKLVAEVEALTEGEITVPVHISGLPKNKRLRLLPNQISVKYSTGLSHYDVISPELFDVIVKYEDVIKNSSKIPVYIRAVPSYVNVIQYYPEQIGYLKMDVAE